MSTEWTYGFCAVPPCGLACESCFCPCVVFGRTHERSKGTLQPESVNTACLCYTFGCLTGLFPVILCIERQRLRKQYDIEGAYVGTAGVPGAALETCWSNLSAKPSPGLRRPLLRHCSRTRPSTG
ncbi:hypothetical protein BJY00DRAFT_94541 [Aspergillus carlsbadensis]|nr:hypothetical protein BJY00DRAFT_94541 [Aspergillus carlsbadensis]